MTFRGRLLAALVVAVTLVGACSGDDSDDGDPGTTEAVETSESSTSSTDTSSSTTDPDAAVEAEVEAAYLAYLDAFLDVLSDPNPESPLIGAHTTGAERDRLLGAVSELIAAGQSAQPPADPADWDATIRDVEVTGDSATLEVCFVDGARAVDNATGEVVNDRVVTLALGATMVEHNGWKTSEIRTFERRDGRWTCEPWPD